MIKIKLKQFFILFIFLFSLKIKAQNNEGGIYMLQFKIDNDLSDEDIFHYNFDAQGIWLGLVIGLGFACLFLFLRLIKNLRSLS